MAGVVGVAGPPDGQPVGRGVVQDEREGAGGVDGDPGDDGWWLVEVGDAGGVGADGAHGPVAGLWGGLGGERGRLRRGLGWRWGALVTEVAAAHWCRHASVAATPAASIPAPASTTRTRTLKCWAVLGGRECREGGRVKGASGGAEDAADEGA